MAINWPTIAQGSGTGTTYTPPAPNYNTWTWNGYAWTSKSTTPRGGFGGTWVIFDQYGKARSFPLLQSAIDYASSGDTINLFQNTREHVTTSYHVRLTKDININLNGFEYILDGKSTISLSGYAISNVNTFEIDGFTPASLYEIDVKIYNGKITLVNVLNNSDLSHPAPLILIGEPMNNSTYTNLNTGSNWNFNNVVFKSCAIEQVVGHFCSSVNGGTFYSNEIVRTTHGGVGVVLNVVSKSPNKLLTIFRNITSISETGTAIIYRNLTEVNGNRNYLINCKGETRKPVNDYDARGINAEGANQYGNSMYNCTGTAPRQFTYEIEGGSNVGGIYAGPKIKAVKCTGTTIKGYAGIQSNSTTLAHCVGRSTLTGFRSNGGTQFKLCSNGYAPLMSIGIIVSSGPMGATYLNGDSIENCSLEGNSSAISRDSVSSSVGHYVNVFNSVLKGGNSGIELSFYTNTQLRAANNVISYNEVSLDASVNSIIIGGATGSIIANNVLKGKGGSIANGSYAIRTDNYGTTSTIYMSGNSCVNYDSMFSPGPPASPFMSYIIQGMTASSNNFGTITQTYYITQNR